MSMCYWEGAINCYNHESMGGWFTGAYRHLFATYSVGHESFSGINQPMEALPHLSSPLTDHQSNLSLSALPFICMWRFEMCLIMNVLEYNAPFSLLYIHAFLLLLLSLCSSDCSGRPATRSLWMHLYESVNCDNTPVVLKHDSLQSYKPKLYEFLSQISIHQRTAETCHQTTRIHRVNEDPGPLNVLYEVV